MRTWESGFVNVIFWQFRSVLCAFPEEGQMRRKTGLSKTSRTGEKAGKAQAQLGTSPGRGLRQAMNEHQLNTNSTSEALIDPKRLQSVRFGRWTHSSAPALRTIADRPRLHINVLILNDLVPPFGPKSLRFCLPHQHLCVLYCARQSPSLRPLFESNSSALTRATNKQAHQQTQLYHHETTSRHADSRSRNPKLRFLRHLHCNPGLDHGEQ